MKIVQNETLEVGDIQGDLLERKPLPIGRTQFMQWADRIIKASLVEASEDSMRHTLAVMMMHLGPTEAFKEDGYFVLALRKAAVQETAHAMMVEYQEAKKLRLQKEEQERKNAEATAPTLRAVDGLLENKEL